MLEIESLFRESPCERWLIRINWSSSLT